MSRTARVPYVSFQRDIEWRNKHLNQSCRVARLYDAWNRWYGDANPPFQRRWEPGLEALRAIVREAESDRRRVRALGGSWSLSQAAMTEDYLVNTKPLNHCQLGIPRELCTPTSPVPPEHLVFAQCGTSVIELNQVLEANRLSLRTSGASNGQTLAGGVSTGTHGSAVEVGSMADCVHALHLVGEGGIDYLIQRRSRPVATPAMATVLGARLLEDDDLFHAALVGFGSFGIVHALVLEVEPIYLLEEHAARFDYPQVRHAMRTLDVSGLGLAGGASLPFHFEIILNPYRDEEGQSGAYVKYMYKREYRVPPPTSSPVVTHGPSEDLISLIGVITGGLPEIIDSTVAGALISKFMKDQLKGPKTPGLGTHGQTFGGTNLRGRVLSSEIGVPLDVTDRAAEIIMDQARKHAFIGVVALRYVRSSSATLAFTRHSPYTCTIELPGAYSQRTKTFFEAVWAELRSAGIPQTFHWGQLMPCDPQQLREGYGPAFDSWLGARRGFLTESGRRTFSNPMLDECGLAN